MAVIKKQKLIIYFLAHPLIFYKTTVVYGKETFSWLVICRLLRNASGIYKDGLSVCVYGPLEHL